MTTAIVPSSAAPVAAPEAAVEGARRVTVLMHAAREMAQILEARAMEELWRLRPLVPDESWPAFVGLHLPVDVETADLMVRTWAAARQRRELREAVQHEPTAAVAVLRQSVDAGVRIEDATDEQVVRILSSPPRLRQRTIRRLIEAAPAEAPGTEEEDREFAADAAEQRRLAPLLKRVQDLASAAAGLRMDAEVVLRRPPHPRQRRDLTLWTDNALASFERIADLASGRSGGGPVEIVE